MESARINSRNILCVSKIIQNTVGEVYVVLSYIIGARFPRGFVFLDTIWLTVVLLRTPYQPKETIHQLA